jgi:hypothetical protein
MKMRTPLKKLFQNINIELMLLGGSSALSFYMLGAYSAGTTICGDIIPNHKWIIMVLISITMTYLFITKLKK